MLLEPCISAAHRVCSCPLYGTAAALGKGRPAWTLLPLPPLGFLWRKQGSQVQLPQEPFGVPMELSLPLRLFDAILLSSAHCSTSDAIWPCRWAPGLGTSESVAERLFFPVLILPSLCRVCAVCKGTAFIPQAREAWGASSRAAHASAAPLADAPLHPLQMHLNITASHCRPAVSQQGRMCVCISQDALWLECRGSGWGLLEAVLFVCRRLGLGGG